MTTVTGIAVAISGKHDTLDRDLSAAKNSVTRFAHEVTHILTEGFAGGFESVVGLAERAFSIAEESFTKLNALKAHAQTFDTDIKSMQELEYIAAQAGIPIETMNVGLRQLEKNVSNAVRGLGPARKSFEELGLSARSIAALPLVERISTISSAISKMSDETRKAGVAYGIFREYGVRMMGVVGEDMPKLVKEFESLGIAITHDDEKIIMMARSASAQFGFLWEGFKNKLSIPILDALSSIIKKFNEMVIASGGINVVTAGMGVGILKVMNAMEHGIYTVIDAFGSLEQTMLRIEKTANFMKSPIEAVAQFFAKKNMQEELRVQITKDQGYPATADQVDKKWNKIVQDEGISPEESRAAQIQKRLDQLDAAQANGPKRTYMTDEPLKRAEDKYDVLTSPFASVMKTLSSGMEALNEKTERRSRVEEAAEHATDDLMKGMKKAAKEADTWLANLKYQVGENGELKEKSGKGLSSTANSILDEAFKKDQTKQVEIPQYIKDDFVDLYKTISGTDAKDKQGMGNDYSLMSLFNQEIAQVRGAPGQTNRTNLDALSDDLMKFMKEKELSKAPEMQVKITIMAPKELKDLVNAEGKYTVKGFESTKATIYKVFGDAAAEM